MTTEIKIEGMMCPHCTGRVTKALAEAGAEADVSLEAGTASVTWSGDPPLDVLIKAVEDAGYPVTSVDEEIAKQPVTAAE